jgi:hypothetical protein
MIEYSKVISLMEQYYIREHEKIKHHRNKVREINESTVIKAFQSGEAIVRVFIEEIDKEILITPESSEDDIRKYLGKKFIAADKGNKRKK